MSLIARVTEGINPILVKEVRASLRGRVFRVLFSIVALGSVCVALMMIANLAPRADGDGVGRMFFGTMYACLCVAVLGFVPILAFLSMGSEYDEHTYELLEISNLRPRQIVLGKLLTAAIEAMLYTSVFAPLLVFAFLLRGVDIVQAMVVLSWAILGSSSASAIALAMSSLSRIRALRVVLLAVVAGGCVGLVALMWNLAESYAFSSWRTGRMSVDELVIAYLTIIGFGLLGTVVAVERITHQEENHSTAPRVLVTTAAVVTQSWLFAIVGKSRLSHEDVVIGAVMQIVVLSIFHVFFATEREALPRRVRLDVSPRSWLALLGTPFLPGGGRALLCFLLQIAIVLGGTWACLKRMPAPTASWFVIVTEDPRRLIVLVAYFWILLAGLSLLTMRWTNPREGSASKGNPTVRRWLSRVLIPVVFLVALLGPPIVTFLAGSNVSTSFTHPLNPFWTLGATDPGFPKDTVALVVVAVAVLVLLANMPRIVSSVRDVLAASRENRARRTGT